MANHKGPVPDWLDAEYMENILKESGYSKNISVSNIEISAGSKEGDNYACQIFRIALHLKNGNEESKLSLIGKYKLKTKLIESIKDDAIDIFDTEANFFNFMPDLMKSALERENVDFIPNCLYVDSEKDIIIMEDLVSTGYELQPRGIFLNKVQSILVVSALAELHGASFKIMKTQPDIKDKFAKSFWSSERNKPLEKFIDNSQNCLRKCIDKYDLPQKYKDELWKTKEKLDAEWFKVCDFEKDHLNFLLHGDCWMNNMMFHYNNKTADKMKFLDFQTYNFGCFANDLQYFLFTSVEHDVIINDLDEFLKIYYDKLISVAPEIPNLTLDRIKSEFAERYYYGYLICVTFRPMITKKTPPDLEEVIDGKEVSFGFDGDFYNKSLKPLMDFFDSVGLFN